MASGTCGSSLTWTLDSGGTLTISGEGAMSGYGTKQSGDRWITTAPWSGNIDDIKTLIIDDGVTSVGSSAFYGCSGLTGVTIGNGVTSIGGSAFGGCSGLTGVTIPNGVESIGGSAFYGCSCLSSVYITDLEAWCNINFINFNGILSNPFNYAHNLYLNGELVTELVIPESITEIKSFAFSGCSGLTSITIPDGVKSIGDYVFSGCSGLTSVTIPDGVTSIGSSAFSGCSGLTSVTIPDSVTSIGNDAFYGCSGLTGVYISNLAAWCRICFKTGDSNPLRYAHSLYMNEELLSNIAIPDGVTSIGDIAFHFCSGLTSLTIPDSVESIGGGAFSYCNGLTSVTIPDSVTSIGDYAFSNCIGLTGVTIPDGVESIGNHAFYGCKGLTSITIPDNFSNIGDGAFYGCEGLADKDGFVIINNVLYYYCGESRDLTVPGNVIRISESAFGGNALIQSLIIPDSVKSIGRRAFDAAQVKAINGSPVLFYMQLHKISLGSGLTCIEEGAFNCKYLETVSYNGTEACWNAIEIQKNNEALSSAKIIFNTSHTHIPAEPVRENVTEATYTEDGRCDVAVYCSICNAALSRKTEMLPRLVANISVKEMSGGLRVTVARERKDTIFVTVAQYDKDGRFLRVEIKELSAEDAEAMMTMPTGEHYTVMAFDQQGIPISDAYVE